MSRLNPNLLLGATCGAATGMGEPFQTKISVMRLVGDAFGAE